MRQLEDAVGRINLDHLVGAALAASFLLPSLAPLLAIPVFVYAVRHRVRTARRSSAPAILLVVSLIGTLHVVGLLLGGTPYAGAVLRDLAVSACLMAVFLASRDRAGAADDAPNGFFAIIVPSALLVAIIALFSTSNIEPLFLLASLAAVALLIAFNRFGVTRLWPYLIAGLVLWFFVLKSGVHATLAGVMLALTIPGAGGQQSGASPLDRLERLLQPFVSLGIVPIFGFANAGVSLAGFGPAQLLQPVPLGVALGLFVGKQAGVFAFTWLAVKLRLAQFPHGASWPQFYGVALLCGIGFTMSLFIGLLAFPGDQLLQDEMKIGVLAGSLASSIVGAIVLIAAGRGSRT